MEDLQTLLAISARRHSHLCPRQVLGVRTGLAAGAILQLDLPRPDKRLLVTVETDGCYVDGIEVTCGVSVGRRTLRVEDYGKVAATFTDTLTGRSVRIAPRPGVRDLAPGFAPEEALRYDAQVVGYGRMPTLELFQIEEVRLAQSLESIISQEGLRAVCSRCGEEVFNEREQVIDGLVLCRPCAIVPYYLSIHKP